MSAIVIASRMFSIFRSVPIDLPENPSIPEKAYEEIYK
jgi:hypothetical protein